MSLWQSRRVCIPDVGLATVQIPRIITISMLFYWPDL